MLTLQYIPFEEIKNLDSEKKIQKLLRIVKQEKIVLMEGCLTSKEEAKLIEETMQLIDKKFKGVEVSTINPAPNNLPNIIKNNILDLLLGKRRGLTIVGPAHIVKDIKKDPNKIHLFTSKRRR